ncbi:MAG: hypothetical protein JWO59_1654, partial [Chloroflexi bacterium]|nr:hypothetical protein [Chloroflexota bacterium]
MTQRPKGCRKPAFVRLAIALVSLFVMLPRVSAVEAHKALATSSPLQGLIEPTTSDLQKAFQAVGQGQLPDGYPVSGEGWLVPTTLLKAIAWTESKWAQFYAPNHTLVSFDGGYGVMQVTSGMYPGGLPDTTRSAIANNFLYNMDYGAQILISKWLHTPNIGNDDPRILEHWYYALWAYNGWGWVNNPSNPSFTRIGSPDSDPATFPYQERVFYYLAHPPAGPDGAPLWSPIPVTIPDVSLIGNDPWPLPEVATPHYDVTVTYPPLSLGGEKSAHFLADLTVPDGTVVQPGQTFTKSWLLNNSGAVAWTKGFRWTPVSGAALGSPSGVQVDATPPLADVSVSAKLTAPSTPGTYREYWQMVGPDRQAFGVRAWVNVVVAGAGHTSSPQTTATETGLSTAAYVTSQQSPTPVATTFLAKASSVAASRQSSRA